MAEWVALGSRLAVVFPRRPVGARRLQQIRHIRVDGTYQPSEVHVAGGRPICLIFHREETASCSERVVFPGLGVSAELPAFREVAVELPACDPGTHPFRCQMDVIHGNLIVEPNGIAGGEAHRRPAV
jgi:Cu+-exporting ATPase